MSDQDELSRAQARIQELEAEIGRAREAAFDFEGQISAARAGSTNLESQIDAARDLNIDLVAQRDAWIARGVELERLIRRDFVASPPGSPPESPPMEWPSAEDATVENLISTLCDRPNQKRVESWPLVEEVPSGDLIYRTSGHRDRAHFARSRAPGLQAVLGLAAEGGCDVNKLERVLDFGCGCGRLLAAWEPLAMAVEVCGVDLDSDLIDWCNRYLPFVDARCNGLSPPLDWETGHFDLIYAASVFTHLTAEGGEAWAAELERLLRPGGTLVVSYHGSLYHDVLGGPSSDSGVDRLNREGFVLQRFGKGRVADHREGSNDFAAFHTEESFRALFQNWDLEVIARAEERGANDFAARQDVMVFRRA